ncbi:MAG: hypothetical protein AAB890_00550 [Patescibacteria group bacterium]
MSDNCWNAIITAIKERSAKGKEVICLEWGSGNSTINLIRTALDAKMNFKIISVDHETAFFPWLAKSVFNEFCKKKDEKPILAWHLLRGPIISFSKIGEVLLERNVLKSSSLYWQIILGNKRLQYVEKYQPNFNFYLVKITKQLIKLIMIEFDYWFWVTKGVIYNFFFKKSSNSNYVLSEPIIIRDFFDYFTKNHNPGCLKIKQDNVTVELWHLPMLQSFWRYGLLFDGPITQLPDYVNIPIKENFDIIFIDGRARVSCIKRVSRDKLLKNGGWLFVHDAFRSEMGEAFQMFNQTYQFINGSNRTLNGQRRCDDGFGFPFIKTGNSLTDFNQEIVQELFVYQNNYKDQND